ncbi:MAG TPA: pyridoxamine 5'-phosphate oxidase family protein [Mycobacteriales bacterium]|nr:pyridoxamine 5'-phosphate oxidase family protein [Mycobacteriales bacterium]
MGRALPERIPLMRHGLAASRAAMNAWQGMVDDARGRAERERLAPGRRADGSGSWLDAIDPDDAWELLRSHHLGRVAFSAHSGRPVIVPVNYAVHDRQIVIRTGRGPKLEAARRGDLVAFEVDQIDLVAHTGWSVTLTGRARWVREPSTLARLTALDLEVWAGGPRNETIAIEPLHIGGRRLVAAETA